MDRPRYARVTTQVADVAPEIARPFESHWYRKLGVGDQLPAFAVSV